MAEKSRKRRSSTKPSQKKRGDGSLIVSSPLVDRWKAEALDHGFDVFLCNQLVTHFRLYDHGQGLLSSIDHLKRCLSDLPSFPTDDGRLNNVVAQVLPSSECRPSFSQFLECVALMYNDKKQTCGSDKNKNNRLNEKLSAYFRELTQNPFNSGKHDLGVASSAATAAASAVSASDDRRPPLSLNERFGAYWAKLTENPTKPKDRKRSDSDEGENAIAL